MKITITKEEKFIDNVSQGVEYVIQTYRNHTVIGEGTDWRIQDIIRLKGDTLALLQEKIKEVLEK